MTKKQKPKPAVWVITADNCNGSLPAHRVECIDEDLALNHADWLHMDRTLMNVKIEGPKYEGVRHLPTEADRQLSDTLLDLLEKRGVAPGAVYKINRWFDSKVW